MIKHGDYPLDVVKDYVLSWDGDHENYPRLFIGKDDLPRLRKLLDADPKEVDRWTSRQPIDKYNIEDPLRAYFASGSSKLGATIVKRTEDWLQYTVHDDLLRQNNRATLGVAPHNQAVMLLPTLNLIDAALSAETLTPAQRKRFLAHIALLGYTVNRDDYWAPKLGYGANPNMTTTVAQYQVATACLIPSHPMASKWAKSGLDELKHQLYNWSDEDGGWLEAPHYAMASFDHMLASFLMAARAGFGDYVYEERVRKVAEWFAQISTPPDAHTKGLRHLPPIGNTYFNEPTGVFGIIAGLWQERDPTFAAHMQWMNLQHGSPDLGLGWSFPGMTGYKKLLKTHGVAARQPDYGSRLFKKTGVVLRSHFATDRETYLHLIAGSNHAHYDYDSGSIVLWAKGRALANDWGYIGRHARKYHNLVDGKAAGGNMHVNAFATQPNFDYVRGKKGAWERQIGFAKDTAPDGASFFMIRDTYTAGDSATWRLWLTAEKVDVSASGATVTGIDDVDLDIFVYNAGTLGLKLETATQKMTLGNYEGKVGRMSMTQTALTAALPGSSSMVALLYPRLKTEPPPRVTWHGDGRIAEVTSVLGTDFVFLALANAAVGHDDVSFTGTAGAVQLRGKTTIVSLGAAGNVAHGKNRLKADKAATQIAK
jgi:hypothetical protein